MDPRPHAGISSVKPADLEEKENRLKKTKEDKPAAAKPETPKTVTPEWQTVAKKKRTAGNSYCSWRKSVHYNQLSSTAQNDNGDKPALFEKQGLTVDANGNATVDLTFKDDSEKGQITLWCLLEI